jgi:hypothetical protein
MLSQVYRNSEADAIYICGDLNSGIGRLDDYINSINDIPSRVALDDFVSHHGETLLEFLWHSTMCIINGRICPLSDNFTSKSGKGKALVDYIVTLHDCLETCLELKVLSPTQMVAECRCFDLIGQKK